MGDFARLAVEHGARRSDAIVDAVGPEVLTFRGLVERIRDAVGSRARLVQASPRLVLVASRLLGVLVRDAVLTRDEVVGLTSNLLDSPGAPTGTTRFSEWLAAHAAELGVEWASELRRHYH